MKPRQHFLLSTAGREGDAEPLAYIGRVDGRLSYRRSLLLLVVCVCVCVCVYLQGWVVALHAPVTDGSVSSAIKVHAKTKLLKSCYKICIFYEEKQCCAILYCKTYNIVCLTLHLVCPPRYCTVVSRGWGLI